MTEGEKEAIEQLKSWRNYIIEHKETTKNAADLEFYIRTVLNLITKLQKENEYWKNGFEGELEDNRKNTCELLKQDLIIREKNKIIDLMAEYWHCGLAICENCANYDEYKCKICIKQYFEKQEKEKGE